MKVACCVIAVAVLAVVSGARAQVQRTREYEWPFATDATLDETQPTVAQQNATTVRVSADASPNQRRGLFIYQSSKTNLLHIDDTDVAAVKFVAALSSAQTGTGNILIHPLSTQWSLGLNTAVANPAPTWNCANANAGSCSSWSGAQQNVDSTTATTVPAPSGVDGASGAIVNLPATGAYNQTQAIQRAGMLLLATGNVELSLSSSESSSAPTVPKAVLDIRMCCWDQGCTLGSIGSCDCGLPLVVDDGGTPFQGVTVCRSAGPAPSGVSVITKNPQFGGVRLTANTTLRRRVEIKDSFFDFGTEELRIEVGSGLLVAETLQMGGSFKLGAIVPSSFGGQGRLVVGHFNQFSGVPGGPRGYVYYQGTKCPLSSLVQFDDTQATINGRVYNKTIFIDWQPVNCPSSSSTISGTPTTTTSGASGSTSGSGSGTGTTTAEPVVPADVTSFAAPPVMASLGLQMLALVFASAATAAFFV